MKKTILLSIGILAIILFGLVAVMPVHAAPVPNQSPYGVTVYPGIWNDATASQFNQEGLSWVRLQPAWKQAEPTPGAFSWAKMDSEVAIAVRHHLTIDFTIQNPPTWAYDPSMPGCHLASPSAVAEYGRAIALRYGSTLGAIELGNEEWSFTPCFAQDGPQYARVVIAATQAIHAVNPSVFVGMYGFTHYYSVAQVTAWFRSFLGSPGHPGLYINYLNFHYYHQGKSPDVTAPDGRPPFMDVVRAIHNVVAYYGYPQKKVWVTEIGWRVVCDHGDCTYVVSQQQQADYYKLVLDEARLSGLFGKVFFYTLTTAFSPFSIYQAGQPTLAFKMLHSYIQQHLTW